MPTPSQTIVLSPFEVNSSSDVGFVAANSLAGGRMAAPLEDTAAAYSVETREFIDALHITSLTEAARWSVNSSEVLDNGSNETFQTPVQYNIRGVAATGEQRNFFPNMGIFDSYNLERYDFARGANSILFGNGSIGGTVNVVTKQALLDRPLAEVEAKFGSYGTKRVTADINAPLVKGKLALRVNALWSDADSWRQVDFEKKKGVYLTGAWRVGPSTDLRADYEYGHDTRLVSLTNINDNLSGWDGKTTFSGPVTALPSNANALGISRRGSDYAVFQPYGPDNRLISYTNDPDTLGGGSSTGATGVPVGGVFVNGSSPAISGNSLLFALNTPSYRFSRALAGSAFYIPSPSQSFFPRNQPIMDRTTRDGAVYLDHHFGDSLFLEFAADRNKQHQDGGLYAQRGIINTYIDIDNRLPTGAPNPNFLQPYDDTQLWRNYRDWDTTSTRFAVAWLNKNPLGQFRTNLLLGTFYQTEDTLTYAYAMRTNADHRRWALQNIINYRSYWNQPSPTINPTGPITFVDPIAGTTQQITPGWVLDNHKFDSVDVRHSQYKYVQAAVSDKTLWGHLDLLAAARRDWFQFDQLHTVNPGDYPLSWDGTTPIYAPKAPADYSTLTYLPKNSSGVVIGGPLPAETRPRDSQNNPLPQYVNDRFRDDYSPPVVKGPVNTTNFGAVYHVLPWLRLFADAAQTYNTNISLVSINNTIIPPSIAHSNDLGIGFTLPNGRLTVNIERYSGSEKHNTVNPPSGVVTDINNISKASPIGATATGLGNTRGLNGVPSYTDQRQRESDGYEIEAIANLTPNWRLTANFGTTDASQVNAYSDTRAYVASHNSMMRQVLSDVGVALDTNSVASVDTTIPINQRSPDVASAVSAWNDLQSQLRNMVTGSQPLSLMMRFTANFYTDYRIPSGILKGLRLGGGVNLRGRQVIGYRGADTIQDPNNPNAAIADPKASPYTTVETKPYYLAVATLKYSWKLNRHLAADADLFVDNLLNNRDVHYYATTQRPPGGDVTNPARVATPSTYSYQIPRTVTFSVSVHY
ncbi:MAG TPA: TonB-dependent receptor plug domain-containing protein [Opitutaceae bacterium]|nr:TonB-dependent receptor plug domain-containing protein [Opitutaceae bacterium]